MPSNLFYKHLVITHKIINPANVLQLGYKNSHRALDPRQKGFSDDGPVGFKTLCLWSCHDHNSIREHISLSVIISNGCLCCRVLIIIIPRSRTASDKIYCHQMLAQLCLSATVDLPQKVGTSSRYIYVMIAIQQRSRRFPKPIIICYRTWDLWSTCLR